MVKYLIYCTGIVDDFHQFKFCINFTDYPWINFCSSNSPYPGGYPIPLFLDGDDLSGSGSGTPSEDDLDDPDDEVDADEIGDLDDDDDGGGTIADEDEDSWEDIEVEEEVGGD